MSSTTTKEEMILKALRKLDSARWSQVLDFIGYLSYQTGRSARKPKKFSAKIMTAADLLHSELVGLWADRNDIRDSVAFARQLRHRAEHRHGELNAPA